MKRLIAVAFLLFTLFAASGVQAQERQYTPYQQALKDFLEASGTLGSMEPIVDQLMNMMGQFYPSLDEKVIEMYKQEMKSELVDNVIDVFEDIYKKRLTEEDLKEITAFYKSPVGLKWSSSILEMSVDALQQGEKLGERIAQRINERLAGDGLIEL